MMINKKNKKITLLVIILAILLVAAVVGTYFMWFQKSQNSESSKPNPTVQNKDSNHQESSNPSSSDTSDDSVVTGPAPTVEKSAPFPIENAHYKIEQDSPSSYTITLYAIINNPNQYDEYRSQLSQYKKEALDYLKYRFGETSSKFTITWNPEDAQNI